jgi:predicted metalloprotease
LVATLMAVFAACGGDDGGASITDRAEDATTEQREDVQDARADEEEVTTEEDLSYEDTISFALEEVQAFWSDELPATYGIEYAEITPEQIIPYDASTDPSEYSDCFEGASYEDVADNAFYCALDQTVSYDDSGLFPDLYSQFGPFALAMVLAHEWGHAIQDQTVGLINLNQSQDTVYTETQADCFAGAWAGYLDSGAGSRDLQTGDLDVGLAGMISFGDPIGTDPEAQGAHGAGFDRVLAFQRGFVNGAASCFEWAENPPIIVEVPFSNIEDEANQGNAPLTDIFDFVPDDLDIYWTQVFETAEVPYDGVDDVVPADVSTDVEACSDMSNDEIAGEVVYCQGDDTIVYDENLVDVVYSDIGDFGVAVLLSNAWANAMQDELAASSTDPLELGLQADCFTGAWSGGLAVDLEGTTQARGLPVDREVLITLSPGDLDEVVQAFILYSHQAETRGASFDRVRVFSEAFLSESAEADCAAITEG